MRRAALILMVAAVGLLAGAQAGTADIINTTPLAYWSFDSNLTCSNSTYNGTAAGTGAAAGNANVPTVGFADGGSLYLNGTASPSYVSLASSLKLAKDGTGINSSKAWTISLWFKELDTTNNAHGLLLGNYSSADNMIGADSAFGLRVRDTGNTSGNSNDFYMTPPTGNWTENNSWHSLVVTENSGGTFTAYLDGTSLPVKNTNANNTIFNFNAIGDYNNNASNMNWEGYIDEVKIWDGAANATQVASLYASNTAPEPATLVLVGSGIAGIFGLRKRRKKA